MFCPECGYENNDENKFCISCGNLFKQEMPDIIHSTAKKQIYTKDARIIRVIIGIAAILTSPIIILLSSTADMLSAVLSVRTIADIIDFFKLFQTYSLQSIFIFFQSMFLLTGGIISIAARKSKIGAITSSAFLCAATAISFLRTDIYTNWDISFVSYVLASAAVYTLGEKEQSEEKQCIEHRVLESILGVVLVIIIIATIKTTNG